MVNHLHPLRLLCLAALLAVPQLHAKDLGEYRINDTAEENISTPVALDVIDANATAARRAAEALKTPAIFRFYPATTNAISKEFQTAFETTRTLFATNLYAAFGDPTSAAEAVTTTQFASFVTAFNRQKNPFPITTELAGDWARGDAGAAIESRLLNSLLQAMRRPVRPDELPADFTPGETLRLVPMDSPQAELTLSRSMQLGKLATMTSTFPLSRARELFRRSCSEEEQPMARALARFLRPSCELEPSLTRQARANDTRQLVIADHYDAGQIIVQRGETIDAKKMAALAQLNEKLIPVELKSKFAAEQEQLRVQLDREATQKVRDQEVNFQSQMLAARTRNQWLLVALAGISAAALAAVWILFRNRQRNAFSRPVRSQELAVQPQEFYQASLAPQVAQILKEAVVQGLAAQRSELLQAQQTAAAEINTLVRRLDELKAPMQDRLRFYEERIVQLEKDLAERNEENRELLKMKIEMTRRQLEAERARSPLDFNN